MEIEFNPAKNQANIAKHGVDMAQAEEFEFETAIIGIDNRKDYAETRYRAIGYITGRLHVLIFTLKGSVLRVISLRKANRREQQRYAQ